MTMRQKPPKWVDCGHKCLQAIPMAFLMVTVKRKLIELAAAESNHHERILMQNCGITKDHFSRAYWLFKRNGSCIGSFLDNSRRFLVLCTANFRALVETLVFQVTRLGTCTQTTWIILLAGRKNEHEVDSTRGTGDSPSCKLRATETDKNKSQNWNCGMNIRLDALCSRILLVASRLNKGRIENSMIPA